MKVIWEIWGVRPVKEDKLKPSKVMAKKRQERMYLDWFLRERGFEHETLEETERPDFIVRYDGRNIGIEVCNYYVGHRSKSKGAKSKRLESHRNSWIQSLAEEHYRRSDVPIYVNMCAPMSCSSYRNARDDIVRVLLRSSELEVHARGEYSLELREGDFKLYVTRLPAINTFKGYALWRCMNDHMGWSEQLTISDTRITSIVYEKERKLASYIIRCDEVWLLIVADCMWASGLARYFGEEELNMNSRFDKIWWLEYPDKVVPLHVRAR